MVNTATVLISDIIGEDSENSAFVYGFFGLFDKVTNGVLVFWIISYYSENEYAWRVIMGALPVICSVMCFIFAVIGNRYYGSTLTRISIKSNHGQDNTNERSV